MARDSKGRFLAKAKPVYRGRAGASYKHSFRQAVERWISDVEAGEEEVVVELRRKVAYAIIERTPVDTGRARGSWRATIGRPSKEIGVSKDKSGDYAKRRVDNIAKQKIHSPFYFVSNVPYMIYLEQGTSKQAPQGMVALTVEEFNSMLREVLSEP